MIYIAGFIFCGIIIFLAGSKLSYYANLLSETTGLGKAWLGIILMATITSLPELMVGISASAIVKSADLAVGDIFGSCAFNLGILAMMDAFVPKHKSLLGLASQNHILAISMNIILLTLAGLGILLPADIVLSKGMGLISLSFIFIYFLSVWLIYKNDKRANAISPPLEAKDKPVVSSKKIIVSLSIFAVIIIGIALLVPFLVNRIAEDFGLHKSFAGALLLAISTSLPEIAVSLAAVRMGSIDMAVGNLVGSNLFNIFTLSVNDMFYTQGHILKDASDTNIISCLATILMSAIAIIGLSYRNEKKRYLLAWDSLLIFSIYIVTIVTLYKLTNG